MVKLQVLVSISGSSSRVQRSGRREGGAVNIMPLAAFLSPVVLLLLELGVLEGEVAIC